MIFVTGTKRSGTSMWMQLLIGGGLPHIGEPFIAHWEQAIREANPQGFYESMFRQGVFYATNPHPDTGQFLRPDQVREHVVKVFVPGLIRSDFGYIDRVVATMRPWREYVVSLDRLYRLEEDYLRKHGRDDELEEQLELRPTVPFEVEWWFDNYELLRDVATRQYPFHLVTYDRLLADPRKELTAVFGFLGRGSVDAALEAVRPSLRTVRGAADPENCALEPEQRALMDELYDRANRRLELSQAFIAELDTQQQQLEERFGAVDKERQREDKRSAT